MSCPKEYQCLKDGVFDDEKGRVHKLDVCLTIDRYKSCPHYIEFIKNPEDDRGPEDPYKKILEDEG